MATTVSRDVDYFKRVHLEQQIVFIDYKILVDAYKTNLVSEKFTSWPSQALAVVS